MNLAHLHLLLNHFPTIGTVIGTGLFLSAVLRRNHDLTHTSLVVLFLVALMAIPAFLTGGAAREALVDRPEVSALLIERHQDAAILAFIFMELTGLVAWIGLWEWRQISRPTRWNVSAVLVLSAVTMMLMTRAANMGGGIRHPEIQAGEAAAGIAASEAVGWLSGASIRSFATVAWAWPALETIHFIGLAVLFGVLLLISLRVLGMMKQLSYAAVHRLLPWAVLGFGLNLMTGTLFFIATPEQYTQNTAFRWKVVFILFAALSVLYLTVTDEAWGLQPGDDAPLRSKMVAASGMVLWIAVIYCGRMLPFLGNP
jgi:uncharacterized membrane protein